MTEHHRAMLTRRVTLDELGTPWLREAIASGLVTVVDIPAATVRRHRLALRDDAIREAGRMAGGSPHTSAQLVSRDLSRYLAGGWKANALRSELPVGADPWRAILHRIAFLNDGRELGWRQILNIFAGGRGR